MFLSSTRLFLSYHPLKLLCSSADDIIISNYRKITIYKMHKNAGAELCKVLANEKCGSGAMKCVRARTAQTHTGQR